LAEWKENNILSYGSLFAIWSIPGPKVEPRRLNKLMLTKVALLVSILLSPLRDGISQSKHAPLPAAERRAILDALRPTIEARLGPNVEFVVEEFRTYGGWAFVQAHPQRKGGKQIDGARYVGADAYDIGGLETTAVLRLLKGRWVVVDSAIGATDVWYCDIGPHQIHPEC
jgi:hypothetical protein